ncbi:MAG: peroxiredoxin [Proteobacteria bacterium]|nr:peroxiredoxin [Pseudomonadota bacterium]
MSLKLGSTAPNFKQNSTLGQLDFYNYIGNSWGVLFSHPKDFTPVCTTELGTVSKYLKEFSKRNTKVIALSVDSAESHHEWIKDINETQNTTVTYPIIADEDRSVSNLYNMIHPDADNTLTVRSVFIIDPQKKVRLTLTYPASTGRNFDELLRVLDSLQLTEYEKVATPANWNNGDSVVIVPSISNEQAREMFPHGFKELKPYLRMTKQPIRE